MSQSSHGRKTRNIVRNYIVTIYQTTEQLDNVLLLFASKTDVFLPLWMSLDHWTVKPRALPQNMLPLS